MSLAEEALLRFKRAKERYSAATKALIRLRNQLPPDGMRSVEEDMMWQRIRKEYSEASSEFNRERRIFTSSVSKEVSSSGITLEGAIREVQREKQLEGIMNDPILSVIAEAATKHTVAQATATPEAEAAAEGSSVTATELLSEEEKAAKQLEEWGME